MDILHLRLDNGDPALANDCLSPDGYIFLCSILVEVDQRVSEGCEEVPTEVEGAVFRLEAMACNITD